jgi:hypothetical protein
MSVSNSARPELTQMSASHSLLVDPVQRFLQLLGLLAAAAGGPCREDDYPADDGKSQPEEHNSTDQIAQSESDDWLMGIGYYRPIHYVICNLKD